MNKTTAIIIAVIALVVGHISGYYFSGMHKAPENVSVKNSQSMQESMDTMMSNLQGKSGDEFDKAFMAEMIAHHQGAIVMAEAALQNAKHDEIKNLANAIISAQNKEIAEMQQWQKAWYGIEASVNSGAASGSMIHNGQ